MDVLKHCARRMPDAFNSAIRVDGQEGDGAASMRPHHAMQRQSTREEVLGKGLAISLMGR
jgi:hypothetical protein